MAGLHTVAFEEDTWEDTWEYAARGVALGSMEEGASIFLEPFSKRPYVLPVSNDQGSAGGEGETNLSRTALGPVVDL